MSYVTESRILHLEYGMTIVPVWSGHRGTIYMTSGLETGFSGGVLAPPHTHTPQKLGHLNCGYAFMGQWEETGTKRKDQVPIPGSCALHHSGCWPL